MAAKVGKKGKKKGQKMALTDFLSDEQGNTAGPGTSYVLANKTVDWAQEMEDLDNTVDTPYSLTTSVDRAKLPTAPKAARILEDLDSVPKEPPFTAFIGNLPYEVSEEKIKEFFQKLSVVNVRLPEENGRFRGFGYVQFDTRQGLIDALTKNEDTLAGRKIRVDLADQSQHGGSKDGKGGGGRDEGPDRTQGDWRRSEPEDRGPSRSFDDRGPSRGFDDRGPSRGFDDRGGRGFEDRGGSRGGFGGRNYDDRGGRGGFEDRGGRGFDDRGGRGYDDRRGGGFQGGRDRHDDRDGGRRGFGSGFRDGDRRDDRGGYGNRDRSDRDTWERGPAIDRSNERDTWERGPAVDRSNERDVRPSYRSERPESREPDNTPKERPRLQLQPRSKPADDSGLSQAEKDAKSASIFGGAKPIDTARREREIEERLQKQRDAPPPRSEPESRGYGMSRGYDDPRGDRRYDHDNKENKEIPKLERGSRKKSEGSDQEGERRRHSSSSSSKGKKGSRGRRESGESGGHPDVLSEGEGDKGHNAVSSPTGREEPAVFVPAPPPKQNIWEVRKTTQTTSPPQKTTGPSSPPVQESKSQTRTAPTPDKTVNQTINQSDNESTRSTQPSQQNVSHSNHSDGTKKDLVPADPPKENPWARRKQEMDKQPPSRPSQPSSSDSVPPRTGAPAGPPNAWAGRGRGGDRGRGRGGGAGRGRGGEPPKPKQERREKPLPNSIDEMPKLETKAAKDFSDGNKFANLLDDADDVDE